MTLASTSLIACHECDLLQRRVPMASGRRASCPRCRAILYVEPKRSLHDALAWALTAAVLFAVANAFPIVVLELQGQETAATLVGAANALWSQGMYPAAALVLGTLVIAPALELAGLLYLVAPLHMGVVAPGFAAVFRITRALGPWQMFDVLMLGIIVSVVKLGHVASVAPGIGLWAFFGLMFASVATSLTCDATRIWARVEALKAGASTAPVRAESIAP